jgi:hypothetical protein
MVDGKRVSRQAYGSNPLSPADADDDPDGEDLDKATECRLGAHPRQADSDGDGANDGDEVKAHTGPLNPARKLPTGLLGKDQFLDLFTKRSQ